MAFLSVSQCTYKAFLQLPEIIRFEYALFKRDVNLLFKDNTCRRRTSYYNFISKKERFIHIMSHKDHSPFISLPHP